MRPRRIQHRFHERTLTALAEGFSGLSMQRASGSVFTKLKDPLDIAGYITLLQIEMRRVTASVPQA